MLKNKLKWNGTYTRQYEGARYQRTYIFRLECLQKCYKYNTWVLNTSDVGDMWSSRRILFAQRALDNLWNKFPEHLHPFFQEKSPSKAYTCKQNYTKEVLYLTKWTTNILIEGSEGILQLRAQNLSAMSQVTAYNTESLSFLNIQMSVPVHGRPNRPCTFLKSIVTGHRTLNPPPILQTITRSTLGRESWLHPDVTVCLGSGCSVVQ